MGVGQMGAINSHRDADVRGNEVKTRDIGKARDSRLSQIVSVLGLELDEFKLGLAAVDSNGELFAANNCFCSFIKDAKFEKSLAPLMHECVQDAGERQVSIRRVIGTTLVFVSGPFSSKPEYLVFAADWSTREGWSAQFTSASDISMELQAVLDSCFDEVHITDGEGLTLKVSSSCARIFGVPVEEFLHKSVFELEKLGIITPSSTRMVIEQRQPVMITQKTAAGRTLLVVARPIFNQAGELVRVINTSKDITEIKELETELEQTRVLTERYRAALAEMRTQHVTVDLVYRSSLMESVLKTIRRVARLDSTVFLVGESGVGKDTIARLIHDLSPRAEEPFVAVNCGAIPDSLFESELFGYEAGAFTGAHKMGKAGLIEIAHKGTLFLDEVTELSPALQVKLLRVLQDKRIIRVGGIKYRDLDIRMIAASNRNIEDEIKKGTFREDLYYRLAVVPVRIPPLRERIEDISPLVYYYLTKFNTKYGENKQIATNAMKLLETYDWPGNVRELQNLIERVIITSETDMITVSDFPEHLWAGHHHSDAVVVSGIMNWYKARELLEEQLLCNAVKQCRSTYEIARLLGISQSMVSKKMKKLQLDNSPWN
jgi:PAS domain S-box-containing protein